jgi:hypothetical protein
MWQGRTADVAAPEDDTWWSVQMTRGRQKWTFGHTVGPIPR